MRGGYVRAATEPPNGAKGFPPTSMRPFSTPIARPPPIGAGWWGNPVAVETPAGGGETPLFRNLFMSLILVVLIGNLGTAIATLVNVNSMDSTVHEIRVDQVDQEIARANGDNDGLVQFVAGLRAYGEPNASAPLIPSSPETADAIYLGMTIAMAVAPTPAEGDPPLTQSLDVQLEASEAGSGDLVDLLGPLQSHRQLRRFHGDVPQCGVPFVERILKFRCKVGATGGIFERCEFRYEKKVVVHPCEPIPNPVPPPQGSALQRWLRTRLLVAPASVAERFLFQTYIGQ